MKTLTYQEFKEKLANEVNRFLAKRISKQDLAYECLYFLGKVRMEDLNFALGYAQGVCG